MEQLFKIIGSFPGGLATGIVVTLLGFAGKYFLDYKLSKRKVELEERKHEMEGGIAKRQQELEERTQTYSVIGSTQSNFVRSASELYDRLSNFLDNHDNTSSWMKPGSTLREDGYYLTEFVRRLFNFIAWGRITQDAINALPVEVTKERPDLQRAYTFVNLANSLLTYTWLFKGVGKYEDASEGLHLFTGTLGRISELGLQIWKDNDQSLPRNKFDEVYGAPNESLMSLRDLLTTVYTGEVDDSCSDRRAAIIFGRLAALRAVLAAYLSEDYGWALALPDDRSIPKELQRDLEYAESLTRDETGFPEVVQRNLGELTKRYRCEWLR